MRELDWPQILQLIAGLATSEHGQDRCRKLEVFKAPTDAEAAIENVLFAQSTIDESRPFEFSVLDRLRPVLDRLQIHGVLDISEVIILREFLNLGISMKSFFQKKKNRWSGAMSARLADFKQQVSAINHVVSLNGEINEDASSTLQGLMVEQRNLRLQISKTLDHIIARRQLQSVLQDKYVTNREGRMVVPVKSGSQHDLKGLIHDASQTKQTVFMEPEEVIPVNNRLREVQIMIQEEIHRILKELSYFLARSQTSFLNAEQTFIDADVDFAKAVFNLKVKGKQCHFSSDRTFKLGNVKHPLLVFQGVDVVPNSIDLKDRRVLLVSGPNTGGKTVLLKAIGLAAQMARSGLPITADEDSVVPFFSTIDPVIGDLQSVGEHLSTFSSHIGRLNQAAKHKGSSSLVLVDEICGSTDPEEGAALARSFIEEFSQNDVFAFVTSHFAPLKENWPPEFKVEHGSLEFDSKTGKPTYQLLIGLPGRSLALAVAEKLGVSPHILKKARGYLSPVSQIRTQGLEEIEKFKSQIRELKTEAQVEKDEATKLKLLYQGLVGKFREQRDMWLDKAMQKTEKKIESLIEDARQNRLKNKTLYDIKSELPEIIKARGSHKIQTLEDFRTQMPPGTPAFSTRLGRQVIVQSEVDTKGLVAVLADSMRIQLPWHGLLPLSESEKPVTTVRRQKVEAPPSETSDELDLRGFRVDEAISALGKWLDDCLREQRDEVKVIHGFGTEQLKKSIRQFLSKSTYVSRWRAGDSSSGGDGVTWITLKD